MFAIVVLFVFVFHKHIVFVFLKDIVFADVGSVAPACYAQSVFTNTFGPRGGTRVVFFHMKIMIVMIMIRTLMVKLFFEGCFTTAFVRLARRPAGGSSHVVEKIFIESPKTDSTFAIDVWRLSHKSIR